MAIVVPREAICVVDKRGQGWSACGNPGTRTTHPRNRRCSQRAWKRGGCDGRACSGPLSRRPRAVLPRPPSALIHNPSERVATHA